MCESGDKPRLVAARSSIRQGFRRNATLEPTSPEFAAQVKHAEEVAAILRHNVVQGKKEGDTYKLRIHEDTERGDNESIKFAATQAVPSAAAVDDEGLDQVPDEFLYYIMVPSVPT
ncbi:hypothetical protein NUW58_g10807 [Xylaria curta]|uniref:Uncharacterized protein n=1 Tax=Xylaria curta TaxID=42375 RepID=A0ACC1MH51_9PEZI|nr:hypothetical protein NUW58_g10807 [Xylaria curta]